MKIDELMWLNSLKEKLASFLMKMKNGNEPGLYKYTLSGDLYGSEKKWGLGNAVFSAKIYFMSNNLGETEKKDLESFILTFQKNNGHIYDNLIDKKAFLAETKTQLIHALRGGKIMNLKELINPHRRIAETRQSFAALAALGSSPQRPFVDVPKNVSEVERYLKSLDWDNPWGAGSYFSHLLFFLNYNNNLFNQPENEVLVDFAINWVNKMQSEKDGCWHRKDISNKLKVNGAMKILTGLRAANKLGELRNVEPLIDTCLETVNDQEACSHFNIVYVLYECCRLTEHRSAEIKEYALNKLISYKDYYYPEIGGFSFNKNMASTHYLGVEISKGLDEPDIHGTVMFLWGITLIDKIAGLKLGFQEPIT